MLDALAEGNGALLWAVAAETGPLSIELAFLRDVAQLFVSRLCALPALEEERERAALPPPLLELDRLLPRVPPMVGAEHLNAALLASWWGEMLATFQGRIAAFAGPVQDFLRAHNQGWHLLGKVCLHLAENKKDPDHPFAFLATYAARLSGEGRARHLPLGQALREYAADKARLLYLLTPVSVAAEESALLRDLTESGGLYHPQAFTPHDALRFLRDVPIFERAGLAVRVPDFFRRRPRPQVSVRIGESKAGLGAADLLRFSVSLTLEGEPLTEEEWARIQQTHDGLILLKGRWVEIDADELKTVLSRWRAAQQAAGDGLSFVDSMRLLNGVDGRAPAASPYADVVPGQWLSGVLAALRDPASLAGGADPGDGLRATLRPYQRVGVRWLDLLARLGLGGCLADDMGLGKTIQVIALLLLRRREPGRPPSLLVVPASLIANWQAELSRFAPSLRAQVLHPSVAPTAELPALLDRPSIDLMITSYGTLLRLPALQERTFDIIVLDEGQAIKNPGTKQTRAAKALRGHARLVLSGTPIENRLGDLWSLFDFMSPGLLGGARDFTAMTNRLARADHPDYTPLRNLVAPYILRRLKTDPRVIDDLPEKTEVKVYCPLTRQQAVLYQRMVAELAHELERADGMKRRGVILAALLRFKQICNHPSQRLGDEGYEPGESGKFARLVEICEEIAARQEKVLVFSQFREVIAPLCRLLGGVFGAPGLSLHGQTTVKARKEQVEAFCREDGPPFFVLSLKAGGTGLNLTQASHVVHFDRWWNPAVENQATDRAFRIGQRRNVLVHKFICRGTVEEKIDAMIEAKAGLSEQLLAGGGEALLTEMTNEELMRMVSLDLKTAMEEG